MKGELKRRLEQGLYYYTYLRPHHRVWAVPPQPRSTSAKSQLIGPPFILLELDLGRDQSLVLLRSLISIRTRCFRF